MKIVSATFGIRGNCPMVKRLPRFKTFQPNGKSAPF